MSSECSVMLLLSLSALDSCELDGVFLLNDSVRSAFHFSFLVEV